MRCQVICDSLGYKSRIYSKGEYVEVETSEECKRLTGYNVIEVREVEIPTLPAPLAVNDIKKPNKKTNTGAKKK